MTTSNFQLEEKLHRFKNFLGVFADDQLENERPIELGQCLIVNLEKLAEGGSHWVGAYFTPQFGLIYIDSFGEPPTVEVDQYLRKSGERSSETQSVDGYRYLNIDFQELPSDNCGEFQFFFCYHLLTNDFLSCFRLLDWHPSSKNEALVVDFFRSK